MAAWREIGQSLPKEMFIYPLNYQKLLRKGDRHILEIKHKMYLICIKELYCGLKPHSAEDGGVQDCPCPQSCCHPLYPAASLHPEDMTTHALYFGRKETKRKGKGKDQREWMKDGKRKKWDVSGNMWEKGWRGRQAWKRLRRKEGVKWEWKSKREGNQKRRNTRLEESKIRKKSSRVQKN